MLSILAIGNSFSQDATAYLHAAADAAGVETFVVNLYIGGCTLETHWTNMREDLRAYEYERNGVSEGMISLREALAERAWDVITFQQASHYSGLFETYAPYLGDLCDYAAKLAPGARQYIHQTWAYSEDSENTAFLRYQSSQRVMFEQLKDAYARAAALRQLPTIPSGELIQDLRADGLGSMCRDGYHIEIPHGRAALALLWLRTLTGKVSPYSPVGADPDKMARIRGRIAQYPHIQP